MNQDPFGMALIELLLEDPGAEGAEIRFVQWLVPLGARLILGERIAEVLTCQMVIHLQSPCAGTLVRSYKVPGDVLQVGDLLAEIEIRDEH